MKYIIVLLLLLAGCTAVEPVAQPQTTTPSQVVVTQVANITDPFYNRDGFTFITEQPSTLFDGPVQVFDCLLGDYQEFWTDNCGYFGVFKKAFTDEMQAKQFVTNYAQGNFTYVDWRDDLGFAYLIQKDQVSAPTDWQYAGENPYLTLLIWQNASMVYAVYSYDRTQVIGANQHGNTPLWMLHEQYSR